MPYTLNNFINNQSPSVTPGGTWSFVSGPQTITIQGESPNEFFDNNNLAKGDYVFNYTVSDNCGSYNTNYTYSVCGTPKTEPIPNINVCYINGNIEFNGISVSIVDSISNQPYTTTCDDQVKFQLYGDSQLIDTEFIDQPNTTGLLFVDDILLNPDMTTTYSLITSIEPSQGQICNTFTNFTVIVSPDYTAAENNTVNLCSPGNENLWDLISFDPDTYISGTTFQWFEPNGDQINNPNNFNMSNFDPGTYVFPLFQAFDAGCSHNVELTVIIEESPNSGDTQSIIYCTTYN